MTNSRSCRTGLLVSVRSAVEAETALAGGADLIDVKEPSRGSLGRSDHRVIEAVVRQVAGRKPVSAAMGEVRDFKPYLGPELSYRKWGFAGCGLQLEPFWKLVEGSSAPRGVALAAYADWERARAPAPEAVFALARERRCGALILDTFVKDGSTLLDWMTPGEVARLCERCRAGGVRMALAGSLGPRQIAALASLQPDWFAVRGAACREGERDGAIDEGRVRQLANLVQAGEPEDKSP